jgi:DnaJ domain
VDTVRLTHLSRYRDGWSAALGTDGWFLRFSGSDEAFADMRDELKAWGRTWARWVPDYAWRDGKRGAWWVDDGLFADSYADRFDLVEEAVVFCMRQGYHAQWMAPRRRSSQPPPRRPTSPEPPKAAPDPRIPQHLAAQYRLLGLGGDATLKDVREAYRALAKRYHPDAGGSHRQFLALHTAYEQVFCWVEIREQVTA